MSIGKSSFSGEDSTTRPSTGSGLQYLIPAKDVVFKNKTQESSVSPIGFDMKNSVSPNPSSYDPWTQPFGGLLTSSTGSTQPSKLSLPSGNTPSHKPSSIPTIPSILQSNQSISPLLGSPHSLSPIALPPKASTTPTVTPQTLSPSSFDSASVDNNMSIFALGKSGHHTDGWIEDWLFGMGGMDGVEAQPMVGLLRRTSNTANGPDPYNEQGNSSNSTHLSPGQSRLMSAYGSPLMSPNSSGSTDSVVSPMHSSRMFPSSTNGALSPTSQATHLRDQNKNGQANTREAQQLLNSLQNQQSQQQLQILLQQQQLQQQLQQQHTINQQQQQANGGHHSRPARGHSRNNQQYQPTGQNANQNSNHSTGTNGSGFPGNKPRFVQSDPLSSATNISPREKQFSSSGGGGGGPYPAFQYGQQYSPHSPHSPHNYHPRGFTTSNPTNMPSHENSSRERTHSHSSQSSSSFQDSSSGYFGSSEEELSGSYSMSQGDGSYSPNYKGGNKATKYRGWSNSKKEYDLSRFELDVAKVLSGEEKRTTLMVKNIPNKYTQEMLLETISENHKGLYDFFYLPIDFKNKCNVGYSFINFIDPLSIPAFYMEFNQKRWSKFNSSKVCKITYARIQGKSAFIEHFRNSSLMNEEIKCRPLIFYGSGPQQGLPEPFPDPRAVIPSVTTIPSTTESRIPNSYDGSPTGGRQANVAPNSNSFSAGTPVMLQSNLTQNGNRSRHAEQQPESVDAGSYNSLAQENLSL